MSQPLSPAAKARIERQLILLPCYLWFLFIWIGYAIDISPPGRTDRAGHIKGHDFVHFYVLGEIASEHRASALYSFDDQSARIDRVLPGYEGRYQPIYGPQVAMMFAPLARLPYGIAVALWLLFTTIAYALCCYSLGRGRLDSIGRGWVLFVVCGAFPPFCSLIAYGHIAAPALLCVTAAYFALRADRPWLAGVALGSLFYKPTLGLVFPLVFLYALEWRILAGAAAAVLLQVGAAWAYFGGDAVGAYWRAMRHVGEISTLLEPEPADLHSLRSFFSLLLPWPRIALACYVIASAAAVVVAARFWRTRASLELRYSVLLLATILVDPHVNPYDLIILVPAFVFIAFIAAHADATPQTRALWILLYACYWLPTFRFVAQTIHVQTTIPAFVALTWCAMRADRFMPTGLAPDDTWNA